MLEIALQFQKLKLSPFVSYKVPKVLANPQKAGIRDLTGAEQMGNKQKWKKISRLLSYITKNPRIVLDFISQIPEGIGGFFTAIPTGS